MIIVHMHLARKTTNGGALVNAGALCMNQMPSNLCGLGVEVMMILALRNDQGHVISTWSNFRRHVDEKYQEQHVTTSMIQKGKLWMRVRDQELAVWKAQLITGHDPKGYRSYHLEFAHPDDLTAFVLAWS